MDTNPDPGPQPYPILAIVYLFFQDSFSDSNRLNPFQLDSGEAHKVERSGK